MRCRVEPYGGNEPYVFFSYCHANENVVYPLMESLAQRGVRVWYDDGIHPGDDWPEVIAQHLQNSAAVIAFITPQSTESHNCISEITFSIINNKPLVPVLALGVTLSLGMKMQLSQYRQITLETDDARSCAGDIASAPCLEKCLGAPIALSEPSGAEEQNTPDADQQRRQAEAMELMAEFRRTEAERRRAEAEKQNNEINRHYEAECLRVEREQQAEAERLRVEREQQAEAERRRVEAEQQAEAERRRVEAEQQAEAERLHIEAEQQAEAERRRIEREQQAEAERRRIEAERQAEAERIRMEREQQAAEDMQYIKDVPEAEQGLDDEECFEGTVVDALDKTVVDTLDKTVVEQSGGSGSSLGSGGTVKMDERYFVVGRLSAGRLYAPGQAEVRLGREPKKSDIAFEDSETVSGYHARLIRAGAKAFIIDCGSTNGTRVNGTLLPSGGRMELTNPARVTLGDEELLVIFGIQAKTAVNRKTAAVLCCQQTDELHYISGDRETLDRAHPWPGGTLKDAKISRPHALIERNGKTYTLTDVGKGAGSTNGTFFNGSGKRMEPNKGLELKSGDEFRMGDTTLTFIQLKL